MANTEKRQIHLYLPIEEYKQFSRNCKKSYISVSSKIAQFMKEFNQAAATKEKGGRACL